MELENAGCMWACSLGSRRDGPGPVYAVVAQVSPTRQRPARPKPLGCHSREPAKKPGPPKNYLPFRTRNFRIWDQIELPFRIMGLSEFNPQLMNCFILGVFHPFLQFCIFFSFSFTAHLKCQSYPCPYSSCPLTIESIRSVRFLLPALPLLGFLGRNTTSRCAQAEWAEWTWIPPIYLPGKASPP